MAQPFLPHSADKLFSMLNLNDRSWDAAGRSDLLAAGHQLGVHALLFEKVTDEQIQFQLDKLGQARQDNEAKALAEKQVTPAKTDITFDEFARLDIRTGRILTAEKVAKTKKLLKLTIDTGIDQRTVVSGIAEFFEPKSLIGRQVSIIVNLAPRQIKGIESQGMILMAEAADGRLDFVSPDGEMRPGSVVR